MARPVGESGVARRGCTLGEVSRRAEGAVTRAKAAPGPAEAAAAGDGAAEPAAPMADAGEARQPLPFAPSSMEIPAPEAVAAARPLLDVADLGRGEVFGCGPVGAVLGGLVEEHHEVGVLHDGGRLGVANH